MGRRLSTIVGSLPSFEWVRYMSSAKLVERPFPSKIDYIIKGTMLKKWHGDDESFGTRYSQVQVLRPCKT